MQYIGELISLVVSVLWTISALASEVGSKHLGVYVLNVWRLGLSLLFAGLLLWVTMGAPTPVYAGIEAWLWLLLSGVVGYFFGDYCLFSSYLVIGSRFGMLFMTLAPMFTAFFAWLMLGQQLSWKALLAMVVTLSGIAITVFHRGGGHKVSLSLPLKGVLFGLGAALGQGAGLVMSMIGLNHYRADVPSDMLPQMETWLPFAANMIRCLAGTLCFTVCLLWRGEMHLMAESRHDHKGLLAMLCAVFVGPFFGVSLSLMAVQYTAAGIASTLMALTPIMILLPSKWLFHQPITWKAVAGAVISCIGVSLFFLL